MAIRAPDGANKACASFLIKSKDDNSTMLCFGVKLTLWVNFMAQFGQKSDLNGLCGIGYWVWSIST